MVSIPYRIKTNENLAVAADPGAAVFSGTFGAHIRKVRVSSIVPVHIEIGPGAFASKANSPILCANHPEVFTTAQNERVSAVAVEGGQASVLSVTHMTD